ncbi:hypothetical protein VIGAN_04037800 [Vigna angularis var. angularis]|uniref:Uncharacterized protein n=1 Tax=Vigna angularis var. angularis TaxID=157739 RepID=A0A0S3RRL4_PHAAN|nr:hypothetical protein VIGAN_04037800 [Vigna angularis var. angularis]
MLRYISIFCCSCRGAGMKRAQISGVMWLLIILVQAYLSISVLAKTKDTTSVCDGSLQECLNARHRDSEFPTIAASHLARMLVESNTSNTGERGAFCPIRNNRYIDCFPLYSKPPKERCGEVYKRSC